jgi:hypothetical protein
MTPDALNLGWGIQRIAALAGRSMDRLQMHQALSNLDSRQTPGTQVARLCQQLGWPLPQTRARLDEARLPILMHHEDHGWLVVVLAHGAANGNARAKKGVDHDPNGVLAAQNHFAGRRGCYPVNQSCSACHFFFQHAGV